MTGSVPVPLHPEDRAILELEGATVAGHACKVVVLGEGAPATEALREAVGDRLGRAPELSRRLVEVDGAPAWAPADSVDLREHVVAVPVAAPLDDAGLRREVARLFAERLDRSRPLWRMDVAPLEDGGAAVIWRTHHAMADGTTAMRLAREVLWDGGAEAAAAPAHHASAPADDARRRAHLAGFVRRELPEGGTRPSTAASARAGGSPSPPCRWPRSTTPPAAPAGRRSTTPSSASWRAASAAGSRRAAATWARSGCRCR